MHGMNNVNLLWYVLQECEMIQHRTCAESRSGNLVDCTAVRKVCTAAHTLLAVLVVMAGFSTQAVKLLTRQPVLLRM